MQYLGAVVDQPLFFAKDGILKVKGFHDDKTIYYPLVEIQKYYNDDPTFILNVLRSTVTLEEGVTFGKLIIALEPWADLITKLTGRDVAAYAKECRKLGVPVKQSFDYLRLGKSITFYEDFDIVHEASLSECSIDDYFNSPSKILSRDRLNIEMTPSFNGRIEGNTERYSITDCLVSEMRSTVVVLAQEAHLVVSTRNTILNVDDPLVHEHDGRDVVNVKIDMNLNELLDAVFIDGLFYETPREEKSRDAFIESLNAMVSEYKESMDNESIEPTGDMKISFAEGAFDSVIENEYASVNIWEAIFDACKGCNGIQIGESKTSIVKE